MTRHSELVWVCLVVVGVVVTGSGSVSSPSKLGVVVAKPEFKQNGQVETFIETSSFIINASSSVSFLCGSSRVKANKRSHH